MAAADFLAALPLTPGLFVPAAEGLGLDRPGTATSAPAVAVTAGEAGVLGYAAADIEPAPVLGAAGGFPPLPDMAQTSKPSTPRPPTKVMARRRQ